jgi:hypothetical protein
MDFSKILLNLVGPSVEQIDQEQISSIVASGLPKWRDNAAMCPGRWR